VLPKRETVGDERLTAGGVMAQLYSSSGVLAPPGLPPTVPSRRICPLGLNSPYWLKPSSWLWHAAVVWKHGRARTLRMGT
jgi:hypothetical protein